MSPRKLSLVFVVILSVAFTAWAEEASRTWTDATGKHKIEGKFVGLSNGKVKLEQKTGKKLEIELKQLSDADQKYVESLNADNPFKDAEDSPFKADSGDGAMPESEDGGKERTVSVSWDQSDEILLEAPEGEWTASVEPHPGFGFKPKTTVLPKKEDFFEGMKGIAVNTVAKKAIVGYAMGGSKKGAGCRLVACDLKTGKTTNSANGPGQMMPLALHDDGKQILMRRDEFGFGNLDRLEVWTMKGKTVQKSVTWIPYDDAQHGARDVMWAEFIDDKTLATSSRGGRVALWEYPAIKPICHFETVNGAVPCLSGDRKMIGFCTADKVGLFDVQERKIAAIQSTPGSLTWPYTAFSPSGKRMACIAQTRILVWEVDSGKLVADFATPGLNIHGAIAFPNDDFILANNSFLIDIRNQIKLWQYGGAEQMLQVGEVTFAGLGAHNASGALLAGTLPHQQAVDMLSKALTQPDLFVFKPKTVVKLDVSGIPGGEQQQIRDSLTKKLAELDCTVADNGTISLIASVTGPSSRTVSYIGSGDYNVNEYITSLKFVYQNLTAWETSSSNVPFMLHLNKGENIEGALRKAGEKPGYGFYTGVVLPKLLQKPIAGQNAGARQTLGSSQFTTSGLK